MESIQNLISPALVAIAVALLVVGLRLAWYWLAYPDERLIAYCNLKSRGDNGDMDGPEVEMVPTPIRF